MGRVKRAGVVTVAAVTALVTGCSTTPTDFGMQLQISGDQGAWLDSAYAAGAGEEYSTEDTVCGISDGLIIESAAGDEARVLVSELASGELVDEVAGASCGAWSDLGGIVPVRSGDDWSLLDVSTGASTSLTLTEEPESLTVVMRTDDFTMLTEPSSGTLIGIREGAETWRIEGDGGLAAVPLADGLLGVTRTSGSLAVVEAASGEVVHEQSVGGASGVTWASDGFVLQEGGESVLIELDGTERGRSDAPVQTLVPGPYAGVTVSLDDHEAATDVLAMSAEGDVVLAIDGSDAVGEDGVVDRLAPEQLLGVSADGSTALYVLNNQLVLQQITSDDFMPIQVFAGSVRIDDGLIVIGSETKTAVLLPAG